MVSVIKNYIYENWAKTFTVHLTGLLTPKNTYELKEIFSNSIYNAFKLSFVGNGRSPSDLPCNSKYMISMTNFNEIIEINKNDNYVHAQGGILLSVLQDKLTENGMALSCLPSINHITLAGAISTGTHGTGINDVCLSASVIELTMLFANNELKVITRESDSDLFRAACCSLGFLGAIISVKIGIVPLFKLKETKLVESLENVLKNYKTDLMANFKYKLMYYPFTNKCVTFAMNKVDEEVQETTSYFYDTFIGYHLYQFALYFCRSFPSYLPFVNRTFFAWLHNKPSTRVNYGDKIMNFEVLFKQHVTEYAFPIDKFPYVMEQIDLRIVSKNLPLQFPVEIRFVKGDDLLLSQNNGGDMAHINLVSFKPYGCDTKKDQIWFLFELIMDEVNGRPHWAKLHKRSFDDLKQMYGKNLLTYLDVKDKVDPTKLFMNDYFRRHFTDDAKLLDKITYSP